MALPPRFFDPFDSTYDAVTDRMLDRVSDYPPDEATWLEGLILGFLVERCFWSDPGRQLLRHYLRFRYYPPLRVGPLFPPNLPPRNPNLKPYFASCERLSSPLLQLVACAYLHISYDLPRVVADHWPGRGPHVNPSEMRSEDIFYELEPIFPEILARVGRRRRVLGLYALPFRFIPTNGLSVAASWVKLLRGEAWRHAKRLASYRNRADVEQRMLKAMTAALDHVMNCQPWTYANLQPPTRAVAPAWSVATVLLFLDQAWVGAAASLGLIALLTWLLIRHLRREAEHVVFIGELGARVQAYMNAAFEDGETFEAYIRRRDPRGGSEIDSSGTPSPA